MRRRNFLRGGPWLLLLVVFFMVEAALLQAEPASYDLANCNFKSWVVECKIVAGREPPGSLRELLLKLPLLNPSHASDRPAHITITGGTYAALPIVVFDNVRITVELGSELRFAYGDAWNRSTAGDAGAAVGGAGEGGSGLQRPHIGCLGCSNVTLEGPGAIDGDGEPWWEALDPWKLAENPKALRSRRPPLLALQSCSNVLLRHLALLSSPAEALHLSNCSRVRLENVTVANPAYPDGTRGLVIESSSDVEVETANVSTGGDCVVLQSGFDESGQPLQNVLLRNISCTSPSAAALSLEVQLEGRAVGVRAHSWDVHAKTGALLQPAWGRGGLLEDVELDSWRVQRGTEVALELSTGRRPLLGYNWQQAAALQPTPMRSVSATRFVIDDAVPMTLRVLGWRPYVLRGIWVDSTLLARKSCWSTAYVPGICEALPAALAAARLLASLGLGAALPFAALRLVLLLGSQQAEPLRFRQAARDAALNFLGPIGRALVAGARVLHRAVAGMLGRCGARRGGGGVEGGQEGVSLARSPSRPELLRREEGSGERTPPRGGGSPLAGAGGPGTALQMVQRGGAQIVSRGGGASAAVGGDGIV